MALKGLGLVIAGFVASVSLSGTALADDYVIDTKGAHAAITFRFKHLGYSWLTGHFKRFEGRFSWDPADPSATTIAVSIDPASLDSNHAERDRHIRSDDYLDVKAWPEAGFQSTGVVPLSDGKARVTGDLTLHGVTRPITFDATLIGQGKDPWGGYRAGFEATVVIDTEAFGMQMPPTNEVELGLYIEGVRQ